VVPYDDLGDAYPWAVQLPVRAISLDFLGVPGAQVRSCWRAPPIVAAWLVCCVWSGAQWRTPRLAGQTRGGLRRLQVPNQTLELIRKRKFPADKRLGAGIVDGRSVWADNMGAGRSTLLAQAPRTSVGRDCSCTLWHPYTAGTPAWSLLTVSSGRRPF
jgi:5-methyltetrahydropteroyltriglutamate--homocysteine methyltransferase